MIVERFKCPFVYTAKILSKTGRLQPINDGYYII